MPERIKGVNRGPTGGSYNNEANVLADSGETKPNEATNVTGAQMSYQSVSQDSSHAGVSREASEKDMRGGPAPSS